MQPSRGVFTTARVAGGRVLFAADHAARLEHDAAASGFPPPGRAWLAQARAVAARRPDARVRITVRPDGACEVQARPYRPPARPWTLCLRPMGVPERPPGVKDVARRRFEDARRAAHPADDALLVAPGGAILESTVANVFFVFGGRLVTPPAAAPLLPGVARARVLRAAARLGLEAREEPVDAARAAGAEECFLTNALFLAHPVARIEAVGEFSAADVSARFAAALRREGAGCV